MNFSTNTFWSLLMACFISATLAAQPDLSGLSAKERAELARQEQLEAATDQNFLQVMDQAHAHFVKKEYLKSIRQYERAGELRPLNVYPPVKIRDIELAMKDTLEILRQKEKEEQQSDTTPTEIADKPQMPDREKEMEEFREKEQNRQQKAEQWEQQQRRQLAHQRALKKEEDEKSRELTEQQGADVPQTSLEEFQLDLAKQYNEGVTQRTYQEGQRVITERIVVKGDKGNEYKRVEHPWGGKFFFKNGTPISEETWNQETAQ